MVDIAGKYAGAGQKDKASEILSQALHTVKTIEHSLIEDRSLQKIACKYAEAGQPDQALQVAKTIEDADCKARALAKIAGKYAEVGQYDQALRVAKTIEHADWKGFAFADIADEYTKAEQSAEKAESRILHEIIASLE